MAGAFVAERGSAQNKTSGATTAITVSSGPIAVGRKLVAVVARDAQAISSITDSRGNTWAEAINRTNAGGVRVGIWYTDVATALQSGDTVTITWAANESAKAAILLEYSGLVAGAPDGSQPTNSSSGTGTQSGFSGVTTSADGIAVGVSAIENDTSVTFGTVSGWTARTKVGTTGGGATSNITVQAADRLTTGAGLNYNPTISTSVDWAAVGANWSASVTGPGGTVVTTGGGVVTSSSSGAHNATPIATGGGVVIGASSSAHNATAIATGGGVVVLAGVNSGESHSGTVTTTGGGVVTSSSSGSRSGVGVTTGGGVVTSSSSGSRSGTVVATGGGVVVLAGGPQLEEHSGTVSVTGGGVLRVTIYGEGSQTVSGCVIAGVRWDVQGDVGELPFILDRDELDGPDDESRLYPQAEADQTSLAAMLLGADWRWGAGQPLGPLTVESAGSATISLIDTERKLDSTNPDARWALTFKFGLQLRILADGAPAFTGAVESWAHDVSSSVSTIRLIDALGEAALVPMPETAGGIPPTPPLSVTARDLVEAAIDSSGWPNARREYLGTAHIVHTSADPIGDGIIPTSGSLLDWLQQLALFELGELSASRAGKLRFRSNLGPQSIPAPTAIVNCGGVLLTSLEAVEAFWRVRNRVRITGGPPPSGEFNEAVKTFAPAESATDVERLVTMSVAQLPIGSAGWPYGEGALASTFVMGNVGLVEQAAVSYSLELWRADTRATVWTSSGAIAIPYGQSLGIAYGGPALSTGVPYEWRYRLTLTGGGVTNWLGMRFTLGTRPQSPTDYEAWSALVLRELSHPLPLINLGTMAPVGPTEVAAIVRAERGDRWLVVHDHVDPPISATVRVLGMSCNLSPTGIEADAVTETEAIA